MKSIFFGLIIQGIFISQASSNSLQQFCGSKCDKDKNPTLTDCSQDCPHYLHSVISAHKMDSNQLQTLTIMVSLTAVMTCLVLVLLTSMMVMKIRKKKRLSKKVIPSTLFSVEKENIKIMDTKMASLNPKDLEN